MRNVHKWKTIAVLVALTLCLAAVSIAEVYYRYELGRELSIPTVVSIVESNDQTECKFEPDLPSETSALRKSHSREILLKNCGDDEFMRQINRLLNEMAHGRAQVLTPETLFREYGMLANLHNVQYPWILPATYFDCGLTETFEHFQIVRCLVAAMVVDWILNTTPDTFHFTNILLLTKAATQSTHPGHFALANQCMEQIGYLVQYSAVVDVISDDQRCIISWLVTRNNLLHLDASVERLEDCIRRMFAGANLDRCCVHTAVYRQWQRRTIYTVDKYWALEAIGAFSPTDVDTESVAERLKRILPLTDAVYEAIQDMKMSMKRRAELKEQIMQSIE
jgi:hypothetical protein